MNGYKAALWLVLGLIYVPIFWILPIWIDANLHYLLTVLACHATVVIPISIGTLVAYLLEEGYGIS